MYKSCYSFCNSPIDGKWYHYDDTNISLVDESKLKNNNQIPYALFYQKCHSKYESNNFETITLYFQLNETIVHLNVEQNNSFSDIIKQLNKIYNIPQNATLCFQRETNLIKIENSRTVKDYNLKSGTNIVIIDY